MASLNIFMHLRVYILWTIFWMCFARQLYAQPIASQYLYEHFDTDAGLPSNFSNAVVQDSLGFLWFLHDNGLSRYDGYNFKVYLHDSTDHMRLVGNTRSGTLLLDNSKNPWVIYQQIWELNDKLTLSGYDRKKDLFIKYFPDTKEPVSHISFDKSSPTIWMGTFSGQGLFNFNIETGETINYLNGVKKGSVGSNRFIFLHDRDSVLLLASQEGLWNFNKATKKFRRPVCHPRDSSLLYYSTIVFILSHEEEPDYLWLIMVGAQHKLVKVDRNFSIVHLETHAPLNGEFAVIDQEGSMWFTTHAEGLYKYNPNDSSMIKVEETSNEQNGLRSSFLRGLTIDRDQNLWVTTNDRGISKIKKQNPVFHNYNLKGEITSRIVYDKNGEDHLVINKTESASANDNEILHARILPKEPGSINFQRIKTEENISGPVNQLSKGRNKLWLGRAGAGIVSLPIHQKTGMIQSGPMERFDHDPENQNTISSSRTTGLWEDPSGNLWAGTMGNGLNKVNLKVPYGKEGSVTRFRHIPGDSSSLSSDVIWRDPYPRNETSLYVITTSGIDLFLNNSFVPYFKNKNSMTMRKDSNGRLLIGTTGGLFESNENPNNPAFTKIPSAALNKYGAFSIHF
ncbi:MAG: hypothetical protein ABIR06_06495 [Cyclobacteriaceae bacterium]